MKKLIGITGFAGSGKDTAASIIKSYFEHKQISAKRYSLADPLKKICSELFHVPLDEFYDRSLKEQVHPKWGISRRKMMTTIGTDLLRDGFRKDIWIQRAQLELDTALENNRILIIPDLRFYNEAEFILNNGGVIINCIRDEQNRDMTHFQHESEQGLEGIDMIKVENNGTLEEFNHKLITILDNL